MIDTKRELRRYKLKLLTIAAFCILTAVFMAVDDSEFSFDPGYLYAIKVPGDYPTLNEALRHVPPGGNIWIGSADAVEFPIISTQVNVTLYCNEDVTLKIPKDIPFIFAEFTYMPGNETTMLRRRCNEKYEDGTFEFRLFSNLSELQKADRLTPEFIDRLINEPFPYGLSAPK